MPFVGAETALAATIDLGDDKYFIICKKVVPGASKALLRLFNDFHEDSTTYKNHLVRQSELVSQLEVVGGAPTSIVKSPGSAGMKASDLEGTNLHRAIIPLFV